MEIIRQKFLFLCWVGLVAILFTATFARVSANVTLQKFTATATSTKIQLNWTTASETNTNVFNVLRADSQNGTFTKLNGTKAISGCPLGCITGGSYSYEDTTVVPGKTYYYKIEAVSSGGTQQSDVVQAKITAPTNTPAPTATKTSTPLPTATKTNTLAPNAPTYTPAPTNTPTPIPTATNTLAPNAPTFTPAPKIQATPTAPRVAVAPKPGASPAPSVPPAVANNSAPASDPAPVVIVPNPASELVEEEEEEIATETITSPAWKPLATVGMVLASGALGFGGIILFGIAALVFLRAHLR
ncbi:MAG: hypothetical protein HY868_24250 [Chloroflexi bacterium]|nr:hypothetical protein [Chloroflexota bacterium]